MITTQLTPADIRNQIAKLEDVKIMICDTGLSYDKLNETITELKRLHNELTGFKKYNV